MKAKSQTSNQSLTVVTEPDAFFGELVNNALTNQKIRVLPRTELYLSNLLKQFISSDNFFQRDAEGNIREEPLAVLVMEALEQAAQKAQGAVFRYVGDVSLYVAGFFQESLSRKIVDVDYYIGMGGAAYRYAAARTTEKSMSRVYDELASKFPNLVDVIGEVSERTLPTQDEKDILRLYEIWVKTGSDRAKRALEKVGIVPNASIKKDVQ